MVDVIVIGAGAAGIAAARVLVAAGRDVLMLEAAPRIGGRAHTAMAEGFPVDLGCGWLHSANRNDWVPIAEKLQLSIDRTPPFWERQSGAQDFSAAEQAEFRAALNDFFARVHAAGAIEPDAPASTLFEPGLRWNALIDAISCYYNGAPWCDVSIRDFNAYVDTEINWRVREGYGALVAAYARGLPIRCDCAVETLEWGGAGVRAVTAQGVIEARFWRGSACVFRRFCRTKLRPRLRCRWGPWRKCFCVSPSPKYCRAKGICSGASTRWRQAPIMCARSAGR